MKVQIHQITCRNDPSSICNRNSAAIMSPKKSATLTSVTTGIGFHSFNRQASLAGVKNREVTANGLLIYLNCFKVLIFVKPGFKSFLHPLCYRFTLRATSFLLNKMNKKRRLISEKNSHGLLPSEGLSNF